MNVIIISLEEIYYLKVTVKKYRMRLMNYLANPRIAHILLLTMEALNLLYGIVKMLCTKRILCPRNS